MKTREMMVEVLRMIMTNMDGLHYNYTDIKNIAEGLHDDYEFLHALEGLVAEFADMYYENNLSGGVAE